MRVRSQQPRNHEIVVPERPIAEVVRELFEKSKRLNQLNDEINEQLKFITFRLRELRPNGKPVDVPFYPWGKLGWSGRRGFWRFVVIDEDECENLSAMPMRCRVDSFKVLEKLVERILEK